MRLVIQRVKEAKVTVAGEIVGQIGVGALEQILKAEAVFKRKGVKVESVLGDIVEG